MFNFKKLYKMKTNTNDTNSTAIKIADSKRKSDIDTALSLADTVNNIYLDAQRIAEQYSYPGGALYELAANTEALVHSIVLLAQYLNNPKAEDIDPAIKKRISCGID